MWYLSVWELPVITLILRDLPVCKKYLSQNYLYEICLFWDHMCEICLLWELSVWDLSVWDLFVWDLSVMRSISMRSICNEIYLYENYLYEFYLYQNHLCSVWELSVWDNQELLLVPCSSCPLCQTMNTAWTSSSKLHDVPWACLNLSLPSTGCICRATIGILYIGN